jgi:predicted nuclease of predicted toxin-antitoxin system
MKILIDMNLSPRWVRFFSAANIEAIHWSSVGPASAADTEIMAYARSNGFLVLTHDLDFGSILAATRSDKPSVIQIRMGDVSPDNSAALVISAVQKLSAELEKGALLTIDLNKSRLRILPLFGS